MKEQLKGIALILFGILLCCAEEGLNSIILHSFSDVPFSLLGLLIGCVGIFFVWYKISIAPEAYRKPRKLCLFLL